jgi:hypothetical protein
MYYNPEWDNILNAASPPIMHNFAGIPISGYASNRTLATVLSPVIDPDIVKILECEWDYQLQS